MDIKHIEIKVNGKSFATTISNDWFDYIPEREFITTFINEAGKEFHTAFPNETVTEVEAYTDGKLVRKVHC
ncbi:hypothetical protein phiOC_p335 [Ochrobactrum phage vB_OspM_OC]|nr:hypothetical protein phiOC_p335 [Ochrobactrum phage vB_OspM_OC]